MASPSTPELATLKGITNPRALFAILVVSAVLLGALVFIVYGHGRAESSPQWVRALPALNALLNAASACFLVMAYRAVRRRDFARHARLMLSAFATSALFLVSYVTYHSLHGDTLFHGQGAIRTAYFLVLITHIVLSALVLPLVLSSFFFALAGRFPNHKKLARYTLPLWLYVSVTGVLVFFLLRAYG